MFNGLTNGEILPGAVWGWQQYRWRLHKFILRDGPGSVSELQFRGPGHFRAGELHNHVESWEEILATIRPLNNSTTPVSLIFGSLMLHSSWTVSPTCPCMLADNLIKPSLTIGLDITTFCWLKIVEPTLGSGVVARISITTHFFSVWRFLLLSINQQD